MKAVCETLGIARSNIAERSKGRESGRIGRPPEPDCELVAGIEEVIRNLPVGGEADHLPQQIGVRCLLDKRAQIYHVVGDRWSLQKGRCRNQTLTGKRR